MKISLDSVHFDHGALYNRRSDIHDHFGGQRQGGISTPRDYPYIFIFTGASGAGHGYFDFVDDDGRLHYYGEGQSGDMVWKGGNKAILAHRDLHKRVLVFRTLGHGKPCRFFGEFQLVDHYINTGVPDTDGRLRSAIVFVFQPMDRDDPPLDQTIQRPDMNTRTPEAVSKLVVTQIRTGQRIFRKRLELIEPACRVTRVSDSRYLRASHIKPWADCDSDFERIDGHNGLLLTPNADHLFDRGYITFKNSGELVVARKVPEGILERLCPQARAGRGYGGFRKEQERYLEYHRDEVFDKAK